MMICIENVTGFLEALKDITALCPEPIFSIDNSRQDNRLVITGREKGSNAVCVRYTFRPEAFTSLTALGDECFQPRLELALKQWKKFVKKEMVLELKDSTLEVRTHNKRLTDSLLSITQEDMKFKENFGNLLERVQTRDNGQGDTEHTRYIPISLADFVDMQDSLEAQSKEERSVLLMNQDNALTITSSVDMQMLHATYPCVTIPRVPIAAIGCYGAQFLMKLRFSGADVIHLGWMEEYPLVILFDTELYEGVYIIAPRFKEGDR